ncbi:MAG: glycosyl hydrolase family 65 protein [Candidatus Kaelpia imicola]|nr:glycosyl hydrolase family 65 protein [Candidatus Kaelpia imicola]
MVDSSWKVVYNGFDPEEESLRESICTLANGYIGVRGAAYESGASRIHYPGSYLGGGYNKLPTNIAGRTVYNEDLVNIPNCLPITFKIAGSDWFSPSRAKIRFYRQELDIRRGVLKRDIRFQNRLGHKTHIESLRVVSMANPHLISYKYIITPENYSGWITVRTMLDGAVINAGVERYRQLNSKHLIPVSLGKFSSNGVYLVMKTSQSKITIAQASKVRVFTSSAEKRVNIKHISRGKERIDQVFRLYLKQGRCYEIEKVVAVYTSKDQGIEEPLDSAIHLVRRVSKFESVLKPHESLWDDLWRKFDIQIDSDIFSQKVLRLHIFHLLQSASAHITKIDAGLPARGLHGEAYRGHIFWDGIFAMALYDLHLPEISESLLLYRYRRLDWARKYARREKAKGAMFPWQSGSTGEEETQIVHLNPLSGEWGPDYSRNQRHVSLAIAYNVWRHYMKTKDAGFLADYGAELILSIARFFASISKFDQEDGRYHIEGVMGPDEFHEKYSDSEEAGLKDNAYTNLMTVWLLIRAKETLSILSSQDRRRISRKIGFKKEELALWEDITQKMNVIINEDGIIAQFDGYFGLKELDWDKYRESYESIERLDRILKAEGKSPDDYKVTKQADLLMFFYLLNLAEVKEIFNNLGYEFSKDTLNKNYKYYVKRTSHGSTLSKVVHCYIAHLLNKPKETWRWFNEVLESDIFDIQSGTTSEGIHIGVMGGSIDIVLRGFIGLSVLKDRIKLNPRIPRRWQRIKFRINYRGSWITFSVTNRQVIVFVQGPKNKIFPTAIEIGSKTYSVIYGKRSRFTIKN